MTPYNISVEKPDDEEPLYNALQFQPAPFPLGHQNVPSPYVDAHIASSGRAGYTYPHITTSGFVNNLYSPHSQLTQFAPTLNSSSSDMQSGDSLEPNETPVYPLTDGSMFATGRHPVSHTAHVLYAWPAASNFASANASPSLMSGSPLSQGTSPLTPNTPLSAVDASPSVSSFPSPGSQGSNEVLYLATSPNNQPSSLVTPTESRPYHPGNVYSRHSGSETQLAVPQATPGPPAYEYPSVTSGLVHPVSLTRRHSHTTLTRPQLVNSPTSGLAPYPVPSPLPAGAMGRNNPFTQVQLVARPEYKFENWYLPGPLIPQTTYSPQTASDRRRYVDGFPLQAPIYFERISSEGSPGIGVSLVECVTQRFKMLKGYDDELLESCGPSISIRLNWMGYERSWSRQIPTRNFKTPPGPITRKNLAKNIAKTVQRFIDDHINVPMQSDADTRWAVGPGRIEFNDLVLLSMHHVSKGSWQANLCLNQPLEQVLNKSSFIPRSD